MISITPVELVLRVARGAVGASESPPNTNRGPFVERVLAAVHLKAGDPWCQAFAWAVGSIALESLWPVVNTGGCTPLAEWATGKGILHDVPEVGDQFVLWESVNGVRRFAHTGFVAGPLGAGGWPTIEGNTSGAGSREGWMVDARHRVFKPEDRFVRWATLVPMGTTIA